MLSQNDLSFVDRPATLTASPVMTDVWSVKRGIAAHHEPVLIVEDERVSRRALAALLACNGYPTQAVGSAEDALQLIQKAGHAPHILLVDFDLPGMSGLDLIKRLAKVDPPVGIVMITAARNDGLAAQLSEFGAAYLRKPLDFDVLMGLMAEMERPSRAPDNHTPAA